MHCEDEKRNTEKLKGKIKEGKIKKENSDHDFILALMKTAPEKFQFVRL